MTRPKPPLHLSLLVAAVCAAGPGCGSYVITGRVIQGRINEMAFVAADDPRLEDLPVSSVRITVYRDPDRLSRHLAGTSLSDGRGRFTVQVDELGAGWMDEEWRIQASKAGYQTVISRQRLTAGKKKMRLLVIMAPGVSEVPREEDLIEQYERFR